MSNWTLFSNHGHVLFCLARDSEARLRDVAADVGITERAVQKIVRDLRDGGVISITKSGRRNCYRIHKKQPLRHELEAGCKLRDLIKVVNREPKTETPEAVLANESDQTLKNKHELPGRDVDTGLELTKSQRSDLSVSIKQTPETTEAGESGLSESIEEEQRSLF
jgi:predicted ArsR family transcriptional regulator